jgi:hypothetical protein
MSHFFPPFDVGLRRTTLALCAVALCFGAALVLVPSTAQAQTQPYTPSFPPVANPVCGKIVTADVVALDQVYYWNRLGAFQPQGMIYALERDVVHVNQDEINCGAPKLALQAGQVKLRRDKRPRPLTLRVNEGDCLQINFKNLLANSPVDDEQPATRHASVHVVGLEYLSQGDTGMNVGANATGGVIAPGNSTSYLLYAKQEGTYLLYSGGAIIGGEGDNGSLGPGLFGAVNVEPPGAEWYRSQVTEWDMTEGTTSHVIGPDLQSYPQINYDKTYTATNPWCQPAGTPIFKMLDAGNNIVHSDLTAIITGPNRNNFPDGTFPKVTVLPDRDQAYREFTIIFHDEIGAVQAFPQFNDEIMQHTLHSVRDAFAINYGTGGIGAEILANRLGVGPMHNCVDCLYEEFFLSSWAVGDAAMVVDKPANEPCTKQQIHDGVNCLPTPGPKATKALYPDDPSNVYHSYMNDHVKFRNLHAGSDDHHIFHLHAHQWLRTRDSDHAAYLDSQAIGQSGAFTYEIAYGGSGNRPKTVGDSIFHCHFYPHFAQGMWAMWRVHDVLETGTELNAEGMPIHTFGFAGGLFTQTRALPDAEILTGTPIPAIVPIPKRPMPPMPGPVQLVDGDVSLPTTITRNPGYPFFIPAKAGGRPPHPPLDFATTGGPGTEIDGGLRRHLILDGTFEERHDRLSFEKHLDEIDPLYLAEAGEPVEKVAMAFHSVGTHTTPTPDGGGTTGSFFVNRGTEKSGAPYADPCIDDDGFPIPDSKLRRYKAADIQMDLVLNKSGWHFPQQRLITLEQDVNATLNGTRPPEPFFFRANSYECIEYHLTNLVPKQYEMDDFQVRTPTDILGQHIHLVKFDVTSSDGAGNGWNYEDGTLSAEEVQLRIEAIRRFNGCTPLFPITSPVAGRTLDECPVAKAHPFFTPQGIDVNCDGHDDWLGAQTTVQRWWADPVWDADKNDRTLHTVFTHDHFGPSTHQQAGLYAGLIIEAEDATWYENEGPGLLGNRSDGGPTSWQARIVSTDETFREFAIEFADFQLVYKPGKYGPPSAGQLQIAQCPDPDFGFMDFDSAVNPPGREEVGLPYLFAKPKVCPTNACDPDGPFPAPWFDKNGIKYDATPGCPEAVSADDPGTGVVNYRQEPIPLRVRNPLSSPPAQATGERGDLSFVYESRADRLDNNYNGTSSPWVPYPDLTSGLLNGDPLTPLLRAYEDDRVHIRALTGAHEEEHNFNFHGLNWLAEPDELDSGYRASQMMGISEWYDFQVHRVPNLSDGKFADFLYKPSASNDMQWNGMWGLLRIYRGERFDLQTLPTNPDGKAPITVDDNNLFTTVGAASAGPEPQGVEKAAFQPVATSIAPGPSVRIPCPPHTLPPRRYDITAIAASAALPGKAIIYNSRNDVVNTYVNSGPACKDTGPWTVSKNRRGPLADPSGVLFVHTSDLTVNGTLKPDVLVEPLVLRAIAGECIEVKLTNAIPSNWQDLNGYSAVPMLVEQFNSNDVNSSLDVGLHPQMVAVDIRQSDGYNVGHNRFQGGTTPVSPKQTVSPGQSTRYYWYAGKLYKNSSGGLDWEEFEYGATALVSSDPIKHTQNGAIGSLIIEPPGSSWTLDQVLDVDGLVKRSYSRATVSTSYETFREYVLHYQDDINLVYTNNSLSPASFSTYEPVKNLKIGEDAQETGQAGFNYRTEPVWFRLGYDPDSAPGFTRTITNYHQALSNSLVGGDPETPIFISRADRPVRMRIVHPGGDTQNHSFELHGHVWQEEPWFKESHYLGYNPLSNWWGAETGIGTGRHMNVLLDRASPQGGQWMDYLYRDYIPWATNNGLWGLFRVVGTGEPSQWTPPQ